MGFKDDEIKNVAEKREWVQNKIDALTLELNNLRDLSNILDLFLLMVIMIKEFIIYYLRTI